MLSLRADQSSNSCKGVGCVVVYWSFAGLFPCGHYGEGKFTAFSEFGYKKRDENLSCGAKVGGGSATFGHYEQEKSQIGWF